MSRLPVVTSDINTWGTVLNDYLSVAHKSDGTLNAFYNPVDSKYGADPTGAAFSVTALTNCINDANAANANPDGTGAAIFVPPGYFKLNAALPTIKVPLVCSGVRRTIFKQTVNLGTTGGLGGGTGIPTLVFDANTDQKSKTTFGSHFSLLGPVGMGAMGSHLAAGAGIQVNTSLWFDNIEVVGFDVGGVVLNSPYGHINFYNSVITNNYYNVWVWIDHGNNLFRDCDLTGSAKASVGMPGGTNIDSAVFDNSHLGWGPYGIYQDNTNNGQITGGAPNFITGSDFHSSSFEAIGNAAIKSEWYATGNRAVIGGCTFSNPGYTTNGAFTIAAEPGDYAIWCGNISSCRFIGGEYQFGNGQIATIICNPQGYVEWDAGPTTLINLGSVDNPWFKMKLSPGYPRPESNASIAGGASSVTISVPFAGLISQVQDVILVPTGVGAQTGAFVLYVTNIQSSASLNPKMPTLALVTSAGNLGVGTYTYGVTFVNALGESLFSNLGALPQITTTAGNQQVTVTLPVFPQLGGYSPITARKIYRGAVGVSTPTSLKLLAIINDGYTTTSFTDNVADGSLGATYPNADTSGATKFTVNCQPANPAGSALPFNWRIPGA